ncbi:MAG TPA: hypothetical protein VEK34_03520 [Methylocella sp.]|nr:hypothetical protein [Methylocella sp.]
MIADRSKSFVWANVLGQLTTEEIAERSAGQREKKWKLSASERCQSFGCGMLRHLSKIGAFAMLTNMFIDCSSECCNDFKKRRLA